jgi:hypothetical protein
VEAAEEEEAAIGMDQEEEAASEEEEAEWIEEAVAWEEGRGVSKVEEAAMILGCQWWKEAVEQWKEVAQERARKREEEFCIEKIG